MHASTHLFKKKHLAFPDKPDKAMQVQSKSRLKEYQIYMFKKVM